MISQLVAAAGRTGSGEVARQSSKAAPPEGEWLDVEVREAKHAWTMAWRVMRDDAQDPHHQAKVLEETGAQLELQLERCVRRVAQGDDSASAKLRRIYPEWVESAGTEALRLPELAALGLFEIENRYGRTWNARESRGRQRASLLRQALLLDALAERSIWTNAVEELFETVLVAGVRVWDTDGPSASITICELRRRWDALVSLPTIEEIDSLGYERQRLDWAARRESIVARTTDALAAAPPRAQPDVHLAPLYDVPLKNAAVAASRAGRLRRRLACWAGLVGAERDATLLAAEAISQGLVDWFERSRPELDQATSAHRSFHSWIGHIRRIEGTGAHVWRADWYASELADAVAAGRQLLTGLAWGNQLAALGRLCVKALLVGAPQTTDEVRYDELAREIVERVEEQDAARIREGIARAEEPIESNEIRGLITRALMGEKLDTIKTNAAIERLRSTICKPGGLEAWLADCALCLLEGRPLSSDSWCSGNVELDLDEALDLIMRPSFRSTWLSDHEQALAQTPFGDVLKLLEGLDRAVMIFDGRRDPAISMAAARRCLQEGRLDHAEAKAEVARSCDARPKNLAIAEELLAEVDLRRNPFKGEAQLSAADRLLEAYALSSRADPTDRLSLSPLMRAIRIAAHGGWSWRVAQGLALVRRSCLDRDPDHTTRLRAINAAIWLGRRGSLGTRLHDFVLRRLEAAAVDLYQSHVRHLSSEEASELSEKRRLVGLLAELTPGETTVSRLVARSPPERLHALAVALHRHAPHSISDAVVDAALQRLDETPDAVTFITAWTLGRYFDGSDFEERLQAILRQMLSRRCEQQAISQLFAELPSAMVAEVARRCETEISEAAHLPRGAFEFGHVAGALSQLMNGELVRRLEPAAYRGGGALFVDEAALRRALKFGSDGGCECDLVVDCPLEGLWVEARSATRVLGTLKQQLDPAAVRRLDDIAPLAARFTLKATVQQEKFRLTGLLTPLFGTSRSAWKRSGVSLRARLTHELNTLAGHGELHRPHTSVEIRSHSIAFEISFQFRLPWLQRLRHEWSSPLNIADQVAASLDQLFGVHLGRLTGCAAGDLLGDVGPFLHRAKSNVMGIQAGHRGRLAVSAAIRQEARNAASAIRRPPEENVVTSDLGEIFAASAAGQKVSAPCPEILRYARIAMPREHVRLVFDTVFANACKALAASHSLAPVVEAASSKDRLVVTVSTPFRSDYRKGEGQGITGVEGWAEP